MGSQYFTHAIVVYLLDAGHYFNNYKFLDDICDHYMVLKFISFTLQCATAAQSKAFCGLHGNGSTWYHTKHERNSDWLACRGQCMSLNTWKSGFAKK